MSATTTIEWTDRTWNPVTGCDKVSPGCAHCYAEGVANRFWATQYPAVLKGEDWNGVIAGTASQPRKLYSPRKFTDVMTHDDRLLEPLSWRKPARVFVNSMSDLFHEDVSDAFIDKVFAVMALAPQHTFQILTKRPERMLAYFRADLDSLSHRWADAAFADGVEKPLDDIAKQERRSGVDVDTYESANAERVWDRIRNGAVPLPNVWLGVSVENQHFADERIPLLKATPAAVRFLSIEPQLGAVNLRPHFFAFDVTRPGDCRRCGRGHGFTRCPNYGGVSPTDSRHPACDGFERHVGREGIDWVIVGGESGPGARPFDLAWARAIVAQCKAAGVPPFYKQGGTQHRCEHSSKGGCLDCAPEDLRVREFPAVRP